MILYVIVATAAILLYLPTWLFDYTYLDDNDLILNRSWFLSHPSSLYAVFGQPFFGTASDTYYRPIVNLSYAVNAQFGGTGPFGYHFVNGMLHAAACVLFLALLRMLYISDLASLSAALLFAVHPVNVASVAWIPGRNDVLLGCFTLGASLLLIKDALKSNTAAKAGHLLCFLLSLFTKETAVCLPLLFTFLFWSTGGRNMLLHRRWMLIGWISATALYFTARHCAITSPPADISALLQTAWRRWPELLSSIGKLLFPLRLQVLASPEDLLWWPGAVVIAIACGILLIFKMRRSITALALALVLLPLLLSLFGAKNVILETRLYLPVMGACILMAEWLRTLRLRGVRSAHTACAVVAVICVALCIVDLRYALNFRDRYHFSRAAIEGSPNSGIAANLRFRAFYHKEISSQKHGQGVSRNKID